jgi:hypothetical protein
MEPLVSWDVFPAALLRIPSELRQLCSNKWLKLVCRGGPMLLKPTAKTLVGHKLAQLTKLSIEWLTKDGDVMDH